MKKFVQIQEFIKTYGKEFKKDQPKVGRKKQDQDKILLAILQKVCFGYTFRELENLHGISKGTINNYYNDYQQSGKLDKILNEFSKKK